MTPRLVPAMLATAALLVASTVALPTVARAAVGSDFDPGNIISDAVFFDPSTMNAAQVQAFLNLKGSACVAGEAACLKDYRAVTSAKAPEQGLCSGYAVANQTAAEIIAGVAKSCGVNPRVLIVLLEKEQSLVTRTRPTTRSYQTATGFGCPDTAPCDAQYYGLFNQLYLAARQYQVYSANPSRYGYQAGRLNKILYSPNCTDTAQVFIVNQATAGLYDYTPYVPNAAALSNLYGTGDGCSSYGNRNFWRLFNDWFGSTQVSTYLMRSEQDATVYLLSGTAKYPIASVDVLNALSPLGAVAYVSQQYLDHHTTGVTVGRALLAPDGTVYYFDAGIRLAYSTCAQVADFGMSCASAAPVEAGIVSALAAGPRMSNLFRTTSGKAYFVQDGQRHEAADDASLAAAGLPTVGVTLLESGVSYLPLGRPVVRDGIALIARDTSDAAISRQGSLVPLAAQLLRVPGLSEIPRAVLDSGSLRAAPRTAALTPLLKDGAGQAYLLTMTGKFPVDAAAAGTSAPADPGGVLSLVPNAGAPLVSPVFVKTEDNGTVYLLRGGALRTVRSWGDLLAIAGTNTPEIETIPAASATQIPAGPAQVAPGTLVVAPGNGTVYLMDGLDSRMTVGSFAVTNELGATTLVWLSQEDLDRYALRTPFAGTAVSCGGAQYLGLSGRLYPVPTAMVPVYRLSFVALDPVTCAALPRASQTLDRFLRGPDGTIYYVTDGTKRPIMSYGRYLALGGTAGNTVNIWSVTADRFATGDPYF